MKRFEKTKGFLAGIILTALVMGLVFPAAAASVTKKVSIIYNGIKIYVDGARCIPKDSKGNAIEPFMYNGTTYLPASAIAKAFDKDVVWDGKNASIYLGKKGNNQPDNWLDRLTYIGYKGENGTMFKINGTVTDFAGDSYSDGILFLNSYYDYKQTVDYPLNMDYRTLKGSIAAIKEVAIKGCSDNNVTDTDEVSTIKIYGDGELLYTSPDIVNTMPANFEIPVKGVIKLTVEIAGNVHGRKTIALTGLALYK